MSVSNVAAVQSSFQFRGARPNQDVLQPSTSDNVGASGASSGQSKSYDFTSLTPEAFTKKVYELFNAGKISKEESQSATRLSLLLPGGLVPLNPKANQLDSTQPINFLEKLRRNVAADERNGYAAPGQVQAEQSLLEKLTALQGTPRGVDRLV